MQRLHVNRYVLGWTLIALWLVPSGLETILHADWIKPGGKYGDFILALRSILSVPDWVQVNLNAFALVLPPLIVLMCAPEPPVSTARKAILPEQRFRAGMVDYAAAQSAIALPVQLAFATLHAVQFGQNFDPEWIGTPRQIIEPFGPVAWLLYTGWHLARRKQTLGQYVNRYRLVHPGPPSSFREPLYQIARIVMHAIGGSFRRGRDITTMTKAEYAALEETVTPNWYHSAGVTTEVLEYGAAE